MSRFLSAALALCLLSTAGCSRDVPIAPSGGPQETQVARVPTVDRSALDRMERAAQMPDGGLALMARGRRPVEVPAGSVDALAAAIASAGPNGLVLLKAGLHEESATVQVPFPVAILGENGAELVTSVGGLTATSPVAIAPAIHIQASRVVVQNITFRPASGNGNTAILVDGANDALVFRNHMSGYQFGVVVGSGDRSRIWSNTIETNGAWQVGAIGEAYAIVLVNGSHASVMNNEVSNSLFGIWPCGKAGLLAFNSAHGNFVGLILCKVPAGSMQLPGGAVIGAQFSSERWIAAHNSSVGNFTTGLLIIDGANHNLVASNASSGNGTYDVEFTGDTYRFGFLTPKSFDNTFIAGAYPNTEVKDCGLNNTIIGGALVDNTVEPCD